MQVQKAPGLKKSYQAQIRPHKGHTIRKVKGGSPKTKKNSCKPQIEKTKNFYVAKEPVTQFVKNMPEVGSFPSSSPQQVYQ